jgi:hypothetical protein
MHESQCFVKNVASQSTAVFQRLLVFFTLLIVTLLKRNASGILLRFPEGHRFGATERMLGAPISPLVDATT